MRVLLARVPERPTERTLEDALAPDQLTIHFRYDIPGAAVTRADSELTQAAVAFAASFLREQDPK